MRPVNATVFKINVRSGFNGATKQFITDNPCRNFPFFKTSGTAQAINVGLVCGNVFHNGVKTDKQTVGPTAAGTERALAGSRNAADLNKAGMHRRNGSRHIQTEQTLIFATAN